MPMASRWDEFEKKKTFRIVEGRQEVYSLLHDDMRDTCPIVPDGDNRSVYETDARE